MDRPGLSDREAALVAAARRELAAAPPPSPTAARAPASVPAAPEAPPDSRPDIAARIAALMNAEEEGRQLRRKRLRRIGIAVPAIALVGAILWVAGAIVRYVRF